MCSSDLRAELFSVSPDKCINTESNLSSTVFRTIVNGIGLDILPLYETRGNFIDVRLVYARNQVVHGELVKFSSDDVDERVKGALLLMDTYANQLKDAVVNRGYLQA